MSLLVQAAFIMLTLHRVDGAEVYLNANEVTAVAEPTAPNNPRRTINPAARCVVFMSDRRYFAIIETCTKVYNMLQHEIRKASPP